MGSWIPFMVAYYFNPRSREGSDKIFKNVIYNTKISIHAPAKGATLYHISSKFVLCISIHAPAKGATSFDAALASSMVFQSTLPRRERLCTGLADVSLSSISIHAPAKGATQLHKDKRPPWKISIHAPAKGATLRPLVYPGRLQISIHAPAKGATNADLSLS